MDRRDFINTIAPLAAAVGLSGINNISEQARVPLFLKRGDTIGIITPGGYMSREELNPALNQLHAWGFKVKIGDAVGKKYNTFGGTDEERAADLQQMLDDKEIKAILCARGGYGLVRIIDRINFSSFKKHPKWVLGFSDVTVLHAHIYRNFNIATIHSKMCNSFPDDPALADAEQTATINSIRDALSGEQMQYSAMPSSFNRLGECKGYLIGGNLKILETLAGTKSDINTKGSILFIEDTNEYLYNIDRMMINLERTGKLKELAGLLIGGFRVKPDDPGDEFNQPLEEIILSKVSKYDYPVAFNFPVGHQKANYALRCGMMHEMVVDGGGGKVVGIG